MAGQDLARSLGLSPGDPVLVGVFSPAQELSAVPQRQSAVCVFSVADIDARFNENIHMCFNGSLQSRNMEYVSGPILDGKCPKAGVISPLSPLSPFSPFSDLIPSVSIVITSMMAVENRNIFLTSSLYTRH